MVWNVLADFVRAEYDTRSLHVSELSNVKIEEGVEAMRTITREELSERLDEDDLTLVEVLDHKYFRKFHLPGAINVPLDDGFDENIRNSVPAKGSPVVVYCADSDCDASVKAGKRLDELGYTQVLVMEGGLLAWPFEREK